MDKQMKIISTLGPASSSKATIKALVEAGVNVFRLNFSHGTHETHAQNIAWIREIEKESNNPLGIMADLQGPKLRIGLMPKGIFLKRGDLFTLDLLEEEGSQKRVLFPHAELYPYLKVGTSLLINDGNVTLEIIKQNQTSLETRVTVGGEISSNKGVNIPGGYLPISPITPKDRKDLDFILKEDVDFIALSFVQKGEDVLELRALIPSHFKIFSKIEKPLAIENIARITEASDGLLIARGDLGVEMPPEDVPLLQKRLVHIANQYGKPVIVATQMLESMTHNPRPTRAEASDVANAVYEGADAVMLSAETASGDYPVEAVTMMAKIIMKTERDPLYREKMDILSPLPDATVVDAITLAASEITHTLDLEVLVISSASGETALRAARYRPLKPILALSDSRATIRFLTAVWGIVPHQVNAHASLADMMKEVKETCLKKKLARKEDRILITGGHPLGIQGKTNFLQVETL